MNGNKKLPPMAFKKGHIPWNKGISKNDPRYEKMRKQCIENLPKNQSGKNHPLYGKPHSEETKKKISNSVRKAPTRFWLGKNRSEETKQKQREKMSGSKNPRWRGGITPIHKRVLGLGVYKTWRKQVIERDKRCQLCTSKENLTAHHIEAFSKNKEKWFDVNNGITLCKKCHFTKVTWHEEEYAEFFKAVLEKRE